MVDEIMTGDLSRTLNPCSRYAGLKPVITPAFENVVNDKNVTKTPV